MSDFVVPVWWKGFEELEYDIESEQGTTISQLE